MSTSPVCTHLSAVPDIPTNTFVAPDAAIMGDVRLGERFQRLVPLCITGRHIPDRNWGRDKYSGRNIIHMASDLGTTVGNYVTVGHRALLHACEIGMRCW